MVVEVELGFAESEAEPLNLILAQVVDELFSSQKLKEWMVRQVMVHWILQEKSVIGAEYQLAAP